MTQQVNLLNKALIRPRDWLSIRNISLVYGLALLMMYLLYSSSIVEMQTLAQQREVALTTLENTRAELAVIANQKGNIPNNQEQEQELNRLMQKKEAQAKLLASFQHLQGESGHHILDYMIGFASQTMNGVWITGFRLNGFEQQISVTGSALSAEKVPAYIEQLGLHPVFAGKLFSGLTLKETPLKQAVVEQVAVKAIDENKRAEATHSRSAVSSGENTFKIIEFSVKGQGVGGGAEGVQPAISPDASQSGGI